MSAIFKRPLLNNMFLHFKRNTSSSSNVNTPSFDMENPFEEEKLQCILCKTKVPVDYKNVRLLSQLVFIHWKNIWQTYYWSLSTATRNSGKGNTKSSTCWFDALLY
ncbi:hypothetical protein WA026_021066 [Henosepilachna vigintioctopunctata]|uniref:Uncharacterized protein n=1 Tax=Henosepilachna vigintioctopunctata TaxID=420089 RepID=A0AAW1V363_9CUCU